jgi:hypothetical protein
MRLLHRNPLAGQPYVRSDKYLQVREAVLDLLPAEGAGMTTEELVARLRAELPADRFPTEASVRWFVTAVRIDLEARREIHRVGRTRPVRYRRWLAREAAGVIPPPAIVIPDWGGPGEPALPRRVAI